MKNLISIIESIVESELSEMPISQFKRIGDWERRSSFGDVDRRLLTSPKAVEKIHNQWQKSGYDFAIYLVNDPRINKPQFREVGEVDIDFVRNKMKLTEEEFPGATPGTITIIYTSNVGNARYMATGWILAHRLGHAFARREVIAGGGEVKKEWDYFIRELRNLVLGILEQVYGINLSGKNPMSNQVEKILKYVAQELGTMKSARDKKLRNWYEFAYELLAQYLLTGKIKLNPLPDNIVTGIAGWGRKEMRPVREKETQEMYNRHDLEYYADGLENMLEGVLSRAEGKIFVM